jgi:hypothetical protein
METRTRQCTNLNDKARHLYSIRLVALLWITEHRTDTSIGAVSMTFYPIKSALILATKPRDVD